MNILRTEEEVDIMIEEMKKKGSGRYITQGVTFSKDSELQIELLKFVLMHSYSFSGFVRELISERINSNNNRDNENNFKEFKREEKAEKKSFGNFI